MAPCSTHRESMGRKLRLLFLFVARLRSQDWYESLVGKHREVSGDMGNSVHVPPQWKYIKNTPGLVSFSRFRLISVRIRPSFARFCPTFVRFAPTFARMCLTFARIFPIYVRNRPPFVRIRLAFVRIFPTFAWVCATFRRVQPGFRTKSP
jgi:hypothetical protein